MSQAYSYLETCEQLYLENFKPIPFILSFDYFIFIDFTPFINLVERICPDLLESSRLISSVFTRSEKEVWGFDNVDEISSASNLEILQTIYHYSIPTTKLFYPEPFLAAASFMHSDLWFIHILVYQYWLWFVFIFIIVFFIITFLCIVRWCNMRVRPRRETRGVSRSKCGDLITAIVPVSWAASIIISESTDAIDYFDGFGTTEMVVGIRAYQWGWEYYYPKDIDLNYNVKKSHSSFFGRSLKYDRTSEVNLNSNKAWKFYQNKPYDFVVTPAHLLLLPTDNYKVLNYLNFSDVGTNAFHDSSLFKHTRMFSKTFNTNLNFTANSFSSKFKTLSPLFVSDFTLQDSYLYGLKRQQNFLNSKAVSNNFSTLFSLKNVNKLFEYNYSFNAKLNSTFKGKHSINFFKVYDKKNTTLSWIPARTASWMVTNNWNLLTNKTASFSSLFAKLNNDNDNKKFSHTLRKLMKNSPRKITLKNANQLNSNSILSHNTVASSSFVNQIFSNNSSTKKFLVPFSINEFVKKEAQTPKIHANISIPKGFVNFNSKVNAITSFLDQANTKLSFSAISIKSGLRLKNADPFALFKILNNKMYYDSPTPVFLSNNLKHSLLDFDKYEPAEEETTFAFFQRREDLSPDFIYKAFLNLYSNHTDLTWRLKNSTSFLKFHNSFYLPFFTFGQDYDFQNWQGFIYLEDAYWENLTSVYSVDDYFALFDSFGKDTYTHKTEKRYSRNLRSFWPEDDLIANSVLTDLNISNPPYSPFMYNEETLVNPSLLPTWEFFSFPIASNNFLMEESYDYFKSLSQFVYSTQQTHLIYSSSTLPINSNLFVADNFRADTEDFTWFNENKVDVTGITNCSLPLKKIIIQVFNCKFNINISLFFEKRIRTNTLLLHKNKNKQANLFAIDFRNTNTISFFDFQKTARLSNFISLRDPTRNAIGMYNSYQKVYKPRLDENRSHSKIADIANIATKQPNITAPKAKWERSLGKNKTLFLQTSLFKNELIPNFNNLFDAFNSLNYYFFDYPFLLSLKSDPSRYFWTDWYSRWGMFEVQPSSSSRYNINGMQHHKKGFDFNAVNNEDVHDTENYFTRVARARKNYLPSWTHVPYYYTRNNSFYKNNMFLETFRATLKSSRSLKNYLLLSDWYWTKLVLINAVSDNFVGTHSNINTFARANWTAPSTASTFYNYVSVCSDIMTKREYFYRELLFSKRKIFKIQPFMSNNPSNPLINDLKAAFMLANPTTFNIEYSRESYYNNLELFNFTSIKPSLLTLFKTLGLPTVFAEFFVSSNPNYSALNPPSKTLNQSQYRPMRRGITNMIRLHGTGAVAMPIEIRLQVLASSKDVIHSWAIPSAGVKIDCVPGYSSHRVIIFLVSGIFWGQCMEVCGRYHHWMPIIVYFMKRDLFFLWCTHFVFLSGANNMWVINDRQHANYGRTASFNKSSWVNELK